MADPFTLMISQVALSGVTAFAQMSQARADAEAAYAANEQNLKLLSDDIARQKEESIASEQEALSDRVMRANQEIAAAELMALERGSSGTTMQSMVRHLATVEGIDLTRINRSYKSQQDALDSQLEAGVTSYNQSNRQAHNQARTRSTSALLGGIGSGLQIGSGYLYQQSQLQAATNVR